MSGPHRLWTRQQTRVGKHHCGGHVRSRVIPDQGTRIRSSSPIAFLSFSRCNDLPKLFRWIATPAQSLQLVPSAHAIIPQQWTVSGRRTDRCHATTSVGGCYSVASLVDESDQLITRDLIDESRLIELEEELELELQFAQVGTDRAVIEHIPPFVQTAVLAAPVVILGLLAWTHRNMFADGYIYLHVVQNILAGNGPVFNEGQRVEAVTSPVWTAILALIGVTSRLPLTWIAVVLGIVFAVGGTSIALVGSAQLVRRTAHQSFLLPLGAAVFVSLPPVWSLATTGLETGLVLFWLGSCFALLVRWSRTEDEQMSRFGLVVLGMGFLIRPELFIESAVFITVVFWSERSSSTWRRRALVIAWAFLLPLVYEIFRMGYYGAMFANTATTKEAALPSPGRGVHYFSDFVGPYWLFIPIGALLFGAYYPIATAFHRNGKWRRSHAALLALPIAGALNASYIIMIGGDYVHARLFMAPFFALCAPVAAVPAARRNLLTLIVIPWAAVCALSLRTTDSTPWSSPTIISITGDGSFASPSAITGARVKESILRGGPSVYVQLASPTTIERLDGPTPSNIRQPTIATYWIGPESYQLGPDVQIVDLLGLADPLAAHLRLAKRGEVAGHEKPLPTPWIVATLTQQGSSISQLNSLQRQSPQYFTPLIPTASGQNLETQTAWARAALQCPATKGLLASSSTPLTIGTFVSNIYHSLSRTTLRIPPNPETAYHLLCGGMDAAGHT